MSTTRPTTRRSHGAWPRLSTIALAMATIAPAQQFTFTSQNSQHTAYCGAAVGGPGALHTFTTGAPTNDTIAVSVPATASFTWSQATSQIDALLTPTSLALAIGGDAARGPLTGFGVNATADSRQQWTITLTATAHVTLNVALHAASSEPSTMPPVTFAVIAASAGASITPDVGAPPTPWAFNLTAPGNHSLATTGTLTAGDYIVSLDGRTEGSFLAYPFVGSYSGSVVLGVVTPASATMRNAGTNPASFTCTLPILGQTWLGNVDLTTTGHAAAALFVALAPAQTTLATGQTVLLAGPLAAFGPVAFGPQAAFSLPVPLDATLAGLPWSVQALHFGAAPDFALSNAQDLRFGF